MKISDLKLEDVKVGIRVRSISDRTQLGTITKVEYPPADRYQYAWITWDNSNGVFSGFFENQSDCEIVQD